MNKVLWKKKFIANVEDVDEGKQKNFTYQNKPAMLINYKSKLNAYVNICTHEECETELAGDTIYCPCHGSTFNPETGEATGPPALTGSKLTNIKIEVVDGKIYAL